MRQPPRRRTIYSSPGTSLVPYSSDAAAPGFDDLDPTQQPAPAASAPQRKIWNKKWLFAPLALLLVIATPLSVPYLSPLWERLPSPRLPGVSMPDISWGWNSWKAAGPKSSPTPAASAATGNDSASCAKMKERMDQMGRLALAGVISPVAVSTLADNSAHPASTCRHRAERAADIMADEIVARELYTLGEHGELIEKTTAELGVSVPTIPAPPAPRRPRPQFRNTP